jgi:hypothetical protein
LKFQDIITKTNKKEIKIDHSEKELLRQIQSELSLLKYEILDYYQNSQNHSVQILKKIEYDTNSNQRHLLENLQSKFKHSLIDMFREEDLPIKARKLILDLHEKEYNNEETLHALRTEGITYTDIVDTIGNKIS